MYTMENGLLYHNGKPLFALGQSYYPSYHPQKIPVLDTDDRIGEMEKDLRAMKDAGFHMVRMAALGDLTLEGDDLSVRFDLPDAFARMCESLDLAAMIRLQGYSMNLHGYKNADMLDANDNAMPFQWDWFIRSCLHHQGILQDNEMGTRASAAHFSSFPSVVSFQIYNEPAYPSQGLYDYHPDTIKAYHAHLEANGLAKEDPPRRRPNANEDAAPWIRWRLFLTESLNSFLCLMGRCAHEGYSVPESMTCHMSCPVSVGATIRGEDYFATAQGMDILGITSYIPHRGSSYHLAGLQLAMSESAAATFGKHTWLVEYNARTDMPAQEWQRETYAAIGHGLKGILYYQWRADYPFKDGPESEGFGLLFNNGRPTAVLETAVQMNKRINLLGEEIALATKARSGVAILYSNYANALSDAYDNGRADNVRQCREHSILALQQLYTQLSERSIPVDFARACDLEKNSLGIHTLLIPARDYLSHSELDLLDAFANDGGKIYCYHPATLSFEPYMRNPPLRLHGYVFEQYDTDTLLELLDVFAPITIASAPHADVRLLYGNNYSLVTLINYDPLERPIQNATLHTDKCYTRATLYSLDVPLQGISLDISGQNISLPDISYGAIIRLEGGLTK